MADCSSLTENDRRHGTTFVCSCDEWSATTAERLAEDPADPQLRALRQEWLEHARDT